MKKNIWIINQYASTPETGMGGRHYYFAREFAKLGHNVYLIAASYTHLLRDPLEINTDYKIEEVAGFKFVWLKVPPYKHAHDKQRVLNWFRFTWQLLHLPKIITDKPDVILYSSPSLIPFLGAEKLSKQLGCKLVWDIRDLWPLTLIELGGLSKFNPFVILNQWVEDRACKKADFIISNLPYAINHLKSRGANKEKFLWLPNGFCADEFNVSTPLQAEIKDQVPDNKFIIGYTGTFGEANAINSMLDAALILKNQTDIQFVMVGGGKLKSFILDFIQLNGLKNLTLINTIPKGQIPAMLACFDVCYVGFHKSSLYRFGTSLNKLPEYFMSGRPILFSIDSPFKPVDDANAGITVPAENPQAVADAVLKLKAMSPEQREKLGENGRHYALANHNYAELAKKLEMVFN